VKAAEALALPNLAAVHLDFTGRPRALNIALGIARGEVIALTDDDCEVAPDWLTRAVDRLALEPAVGIVAGRVKAAPHDAAAGVVPIFEPRADHLLRHPRDIGRYGHGIGANLVVRRAVFQRIGGFVEWTGPATRFLSGDDLEFEYRALRAGIPVRFDRAVELVHWGWRGWASGAARRLLFNNYYGIGAIYGTYLRRGDPTALYLMWVLLRGLGRHPRRHLRALRGMLEALVVGPGNAPRPWG
jgi:GT2 family glycosyltransferase